MLKKCVVLPEVWILLSVRPALNKGTMQSDPQVLICRAKQIRLNRKRVLGLSIHTFGLAPTSPAVPGQWLPVCLPFPPFWGQPETVCDNRVGSCESAWSAG